MVDDHVCHALACIDFRRCAPLPPHICTHARTKTPHTNVTAEGNVVHVAAIDLQLTKLKPNVAAGGNVVHVAAIYLN